MEENDKFVEVPNEIPDNFVKEGVKYRLLFRNLVTGMAKVGSKVGVGVYALFYKDSAKVVGYTIVNFRLRLNRFEDNIPYVAFPSVDSWGKDGFSKYTYEGAVLKYDSLRGML